jgi:hypothetical protein
MPLIPAKSSSDLLYRNERRILYAHRILKEQTFTQGETNRIDLVSGSAGVNSSSAILPMKEGAYFITPEERAIILGESQTTESTPAPVIIPDPLASYLPGNGTTSTWTDTAGSLNVTMTGSPSYSSSLGYTFNGTNQYGRIANANGINNFNNTDAYSVEVWFNPSSGQTLAAGDTPAIVEKWNSTNQSRYPYVIRYRESDTNAIIATWDGTNFVNVSISGVPTNTWVQVVGVFNFTTGIKLMTAYKNGASGGTASLVGVGTVSNTSDVGIAQRIEPSPAPPSKFLKGSIGLIRFYNTALSAAQVSQLFTNTRSTFGI